MDHQQKYQEIVAITAALVQNLTLAGQEVTEALHTLAMSNPRFHQGVCSDNHMHLWATHTMCPPITSRPLEAKGDGAIPTNDAVLWGVLAWVLVMQRHVLQHLQMQQLAQVA